MRFLLFSLALLFSSYTFSGQQIPFGFFVQPSTISCSGVVVGGYCWYYGAAGQSCNTVCSTHGGCNLVGTRDYAGSGGSGPNCQAVLDALGVAGTTIIDSGTGDYGCIRNSYIGSRVRNTSATTTCTGSQASSLRACACNN